MFFIFTTPGMPYNFVLSVFKAIQSKWSHYLCFADVFHYINLLVYHVWQISNRSTEIYHMFSLCLCMSLNHTYHSYHYKLPCIIVWTYESVMVYETLYTTINIHWKLCYLVRRLVVFRWYRLFPLPRVSLSTGRPDVPLRPL